MPQVQVIRWREGAGWLVLAGGGNGDDDTSDIEAQALTKIRMGEPIAYIWAAGDADSADEHLSALIDMGAPTGYLVDIVSEDDDTISAQLVEAGMIVLGDGPKPDALRSALAGATLDALDTAYQRGAVILGIGVGATLLGSVVENDKPGLGWLENAIVVSRYGTNGRSEKMRELLGRHGTSYGLGIHAGSALALGPQGELEALGNRQITVSLGRGVDVASKP